MSSCQTRPVNVSEGASQSLPSLPGLGKPSSIQQPHDNKLKMPSDQPENLNELINALSFVLPIGRQQPDLSPNFSKDISDALHSLMSKVSPFISMFKFILPVFKLINGIIEVICALINPFSLWSAIAKLFNECLPEFLALYPAFALVIVIISLLKVVITVALYFINQLDKLVKAIDKNLKMYARALEKGDKDAMNAATAKLNFLMCYFQNMLVAFTMITAIAEVVNDILKYALGFPCSDNGGCCDANVCPTFLKQPVAEYSTGTLQYYNTVVNDTIVNMYFPLFGNISNNKRDAAYQFFDSTQSLYTNAFINMVDAHDVKTSPKPVFYPTDSVYTATTNPLQAPYTIDLTLTYVPEEFGKTGLPKVVTFKKCIVTSPASRSLTHWDGSVQDVPTGVITVAGGLGYNADGSILYGNDGKQATLGTFISRDATTIASPGDEITFIDVKYTFSPNYEFLFGKAIISAGCSPAIRESKQALAATYPLPEIPPMPPITAYRDQIASECDDLMSNLNSDTLQVFNTNVKTLLNNLIDDSSKALIEYFDIAVDRYTSDFSLEPSVQWTTDTILVKVTLRDRNSNILTEGIPDSLVNHIASKLTFNNTFGTVSKLLYDGSLFFTSTIASDKDGSGTITVAYNGQVFSIITKNANAAIPSVITTNIKAYEFVGNIAIDEHIRKTSEDTTN